MIGTVASSYLLTWKICFASWRQDWIEQEKSIKALGQNFAQIPIAPNLIWNAISVCLLITSLILFAPFSEDFQSFALLAAVLPCLVGSLTFYIYRFGWGGCYRKCSIENLQKWFQNWCSIQGITLASLTNLALVYVAGLLLESQLPIQMQGTILFPVADYERSLRATVYYFWSLFAVLLLTFPVWRRGYQLSIDLAHRSARDDENKTPSSRPSAGSAISASEMFMEMLYQTSQSCVVVFISLPLYIILQHRYGFRVHYVHLGLAVTEILLITFTVKLKFSIYHQLLHKIPALYNMAHVEHHICKTIHPTSTATGLWEVWVSGVDLFFTFHAAWAIPYFHLQVLYCGANVVVHTMWPHTSWVQWHTFHHTIQADVYAVNIPSAYDRDHSTIFRKDGERYSKISPFMQHAALSDLVALVFIITMGCIFHYGFEIGMGTLDWSTACHPQGAVAVDTSF